MYFQLEITRLAWRGVSRDLTFFDLKSMILCLFRIKIVILILGLNIFDLKWIL